MLGIALSWLTCDVLEPRAGQKPQRTLPSFVRLGLYGFSTVKAGRGGGLESSRQPWQVFPTPRFLCVTTRSQQRGTFLFWCQNISTYPRLPLRAIGSFPTFAQKRGCEAEKGLPCLRSLSPASSEQKATRQQPHTDSLVYVPNHSFGREGPSLSGLRNSFHIIWSWCSSVCCVRMLCAAPKQQLYWGEASKRKTPLLVDLFTQFWFFIKIHTTRNHK